MGSIKDISVANPIYLTNQFHYSHAQPESLYASISIGASGAPTLVSGTGMGIVSVVRSSAGRYVITLSHAYPALLGVRHSINSGASAPAAPSLYIAANAVKSASPSVTVVTNAAGTATDPASGEIILLEVVLQKSTVRY